jgi:hypothetical protein
MITEWAEARIPSTRRKRRLGDGMVRPLRTMEFKDPVTGWARLIPGRDQVSVTWWFYRQNPEAFTPANRGDHATFARHRESLERRRRLAERDLRRTGTTRPTTSSRQKRFRLPDHRRERFRLP